MQHNVNFIGKNLEMLSSLRNESPRFSADDFTEFARKNAKKYSIIEIGDALLVSTWYSNDLINDYEKTLLC